MGQKTPRACGRDLLARSVPIPGLPSGCFVRRQHGAGRPPHGETLVCPSPGLRLHTDVDRLAHFTPPDWRVVVDTLNRLRMRTAAYFSFAIPRALFKSRIPDWVLDELAPPRWKIETVTRWLRHVDLFEPDDPKFNRAEMLVFHGLLFDRARDLAAALFDDDEDTPASRRPPARLLRGFRRAKDLLFRYQR